MRSETEDRRRYPRARHHITILHDDYGPGVLNHIDDISGSGVLCHTIKPIPLMTKVQVALLLPKPNDRRVECEGVVVRCEPHDQGDDHFKVAILYTKMSAGDFDAVSEFVESDIDNDMADDT